MNSFTNRTCLYACFLAGSIARPAVASEAPQRKGDDQRHPNVVFIFIDDLRRELGAYGSEAKTPNIDRLAAQGSLFVNQFVSCPTSGASRASLLTGYYPKDATDVSNEASRIKLSDRPEGERPETMFHQLRRNGYYTVGIGKVSHYVDGRVYGYKEAVSDKLELPYSWDEMLFDHGKWGSGWNAFFGYSDGSSRTSKDKMVKPYECGDVDDSGYPDGLTAELAVAKLQELSQQDRPFCLAVGFFKPHLPFVSPKKYWDMYDESEISISPEPDIPEGAGLVALHNSLEFRSYKLGDEVPAIDRRVSDGYARRLRHAYFACISYVDAQVGKVLAALEASGKADDTVVILWGDHGWHLGDMRIWGKHTLFEPSLSSAFIVKAPGRRAGVVNDRVVSSVDVYPTLMELCGVEAPSGLDGHSFVRLLDHPKDRRWKDIAFSYFKHCVSVRTPRYRMSMYESADSTRVELYEYSDDRVEHRNIAGEKPRIVARLKPCLDERIIR